MKQLTTDIIERRPQLQKESGNDDQDSQQLLAVRELDKQAEILEEDAVSSGILHSQVRAMMLDQTIGEVVAEDSTNTLVGLPKGVRGRINQRIGNVTAKGSVNTLVGLFPDDVDIDGTRRRL